MSQHKVNIQKYKKRPHEIEAVKFSGPRDQLKMIAEWCGGQFVEGRETYKLYIPTLEGVMCANVGDYVIKGIQGEFYPCKPDIFVESYIRS